MNRVQHAGLTDIGRVRQENQDRWFADPQAGFYLVADGIGGSAAGGLAAQVVVEILPQLLRSRPERLDDLANPAAIQYTLSAIEQLSNRFRREASRKHGSTGAGSTVVLAIVRDRQALIAHPGDSRAYRVRHGTLEQLTHDHSLVQALIDSGDINSQQAERHPARSQLTRFVGMPSHPLPEARLIRLAGGDRLLLCTDGLSSVLGSEQLTDIIARHPDPAEACQQLIFAANEAGGGDNITALVITVGRSPHASRNEHPLPRERIS